MNSSKPAAPTPNFASKEMDESPQKLTNTKDRRQNDTPPFVFPQTGEPEFMALPPKVRREVEAWCRSLAAVWTERPITTALRRVARQRRVSYSTARRKFYQLRSTNDWRVLIDRAQAPTVPLTYRFRLPACGVSVRIVAAGPGVAILQILPADL